MSESEKPTVLEDTQTREDGRVTRRLFLKRSGAAVASAGVATAATATAIGAQDATPAASATGATPAAATGAMAMPLAPGDTPVAFFTMHEADTVDALVSRLMPGTADDPGAHEAGVVDYIDRAIGGTNQGYDLKTYTQGPFLGTGEEPISIEASTLTDIYELALVNTADVARYGYQSVMTPQQIYRRGLGFVDAYAQAQYQKDFVDLATDQQDTIVGAMADDSATGFDGPTGKAFFTQLRNDTIEGMFSDPMYGGNRDLVGWKLIGYPGAQRYYTPADLKKPGTDKQPQSLMQLMAAENQ